MASICSDQVKISEIPQASPENNDQVPNKDDPFYEPPWHAPRGKPASHPENRGVLDITNRVVEPGSLRHAVISNPRKKLQVSPELWTNEHLSLFNVTYEVLAQHQYMTDEVIDLEAFKVDHTPQQYDHLKNCVRAIHSDHYEDFDKDERMYDIFNYLLRWLAKDSNYIVTEPTITSLSRDGLGFNYGDKYGTKKRFNLYCRQIAFDKDLAISRIAYVNKAFLGRHGGSLLRQRKRANKKSSKSQNRDKHPLHGVETSNTPIDPYYVGLLITMAQLAVARLIKAGYTHIRPKDFYLFTPSKDRKSLVLYTAIVTPQFLMKFCDPYKKNDDGLVITREDYPVGNETAVISAIMKILNLPEHLHREFVFDEDHPSNITEYDNEPYIFQEVDLGEESMTEEKEATEPPRSPTQGKKRKAESSSTPDKKKKRKRDHVKTSESEESSSQGTKRKAADPPEALRPSKKRKEQDATEHQDTQLVPRVFATLISYGIRTPSRKRTREEDDDTMAISSRTKRSRRYH